MSPSRGEAKQNVHAAAAALKNDSRDIFHLFGVRSLGHRKGISHLLYLSALASPETIGPEMALTGDGSCEYIVGSLAFSLSLCFRLAESFSSSGDGAMGGDPKSEIHTQRERASPAGPPALAHNIQTHVADGCEAGFRSKRREQINSRQNLLAG